MITVLIVDDNAKVRTLVRDHLPSTVGEVYECADGAEALAAYRTHLPEWVLMDWRMPKMDGITAMREIRSIYPDARICIVTAFDGDDIRAEACGAGASGFVLKDDLYKLESILSGDSPV